MENIHYILDGALMTDRAQAHAYIAETLGYDIEDVTNCLEFMAKHMMLRKNDVMIGKDRNMTFYKLERPVGSREFLMLRVIGAFGRKFLKKPQNFRAFMD